MERKTPPQTKKITVNKEIKKFTVNIDKLAYAVAMAETKDCTLWAGVSHNNCFWIMDFWSYGRKYRKYSSKEESYKDFKKIWKKYYWWFPNYAKAKKWTGNDRVQTWLNNVKFYYYK